MNNPVFKKLQATLGRLHTRSRRSWRREALLYVPGVLLLALGVVVLYAPQLAAILAATFFVYLGVLALIVARGISKLKSKVGQFAKLMPRQFEVHAFGVNPQANAPETTIVEEEPTDPKKMILH